MATLVISNPIYELHQTRNGSTRTGIFCALWNIMDSASTEKLVDILQAVKNVRRERQGMIQTFVSSQFV